MKHSHLSISLGALSLVSAFAITACTAEPNDLQRSHTEPQSASDDSNDSATLKVGDVATSKSAFSGSANDTTPAGAPSTHQGFGAEAIPGTLSPGLFNVNGGISYSNGAAFCTFGSWPDYVEATGRTDINGVPQFAGLPTQMQNDGACQINFAPGFFSFGQTFYSNGSAYCACDHSSPPARPVHRRPDSPFQGSCGGC